MCVCAQVVDAIQRIGVKERRGGDVRPMWHLRPEYLSLLTGEGSLGEPAPWVLWLRCAGGRASVACCHVAAPRVDLRLRAAGP